MTLWQTFDCYPTFQYIEDTGYLVAKSRISQRLIRLRWRLRERAIRLVVNLPRARGVGQAFQPEPSNSARRRWKGFLRRVGEGFSFVDDLLYGPQQP